jgi:hypothetical protein
LSRYPLVESAVQQMKWVATRDDEAEWDLFWTDTSVVDERVCDHLPNHLDPWKSMSLLYIGP